MAAAPWPRVVVANQIDAATGQVTPVLVQVDVSSGPVEVRLTEVQDTVIFNTDGRGVVNYFVDENGLSIPMKTYFGAPASSGNQELIAAVTDKKIRVISYQMQGVGTVSAYFTRHTSNTQISMVHSFQAREGFVVQPPAGGFLFETLAGQRLGLNLNAAVAVNIQVQYLEVSN